MDRNRRVFLIVGALVVLFVGVGCICSRCSNPLTERQQDNAPIVKGADLGQIVMARGIGDKNSPIGVTDTFNDSEDVIYCVVEAKRIDAGTSFFARWVYEGDPFEDTPVITADQNYSNTYVEFHIEPKTIGVLRTGSYECRIYVNGNPVKTATFTVR
jgi:hypothetical protein